MTTIKKPVSRKIGIIALFCALLALMFLSGCTSQQAMDFSEQFKKECSKNGGTFTISVQFSTFSWWRPSYVDCSCTVPPPSASETKSPSKDADTDGDGIPNVSDPDSLGLTSPSASGAVK